MSLNNASILSGATISPSGGSALAFESLGIRGNTNPLFVSADTDQRTRRSLDVTVKEAKISATAPNGMTQHRTQFVLKSPLSLDNGLVTINKVTIEFATDVETSQAEYEELRVLAAQICSDADFESAVKNRSLS